MTSNKKNQDKLIVITGPTASGKTSLAAQLHMILTQKLFQQIQDKYKRNGYWYWKGFR